MPGADASNLSETLVSFSRELLGTPSGRDAGEAMALGHSNNIDHLILLENGIDLDWLLKEGMSKINLIRNATTIDLNFHQVRLLLLERSLADLGVGENADDTAALLDSAQFASDRDAIVLGMLLGVLGESLLLALVPVLIESALDLVAQVLGPDRREGPETTRSLNVAN